MSTKDYLTREDGERWVAAWKVSGKSRGAFAREHGIASHRLYYWTRSAGAKALASGGFVELRPALVATSGVSVICGDSARVEVASGFDAEVLRSVVAALSSR